MAVRESMIIAEQVSASLDEHTSLVKTDLSPVTMADYAVQAIIHRHLAMAFPNDPIVAEEDADDLARPENAILLNRLMDLFRRNSLSWLENEIVEHVGRGKYGGGREGRFWTLDPIDGTKGFIRGDQYAIALALIENGKPIFGVLGCPRLNLPVSPGSDVMHRGWVCAAVDGKAWAESLDGTVRRLLQTSSVEHPRDAVMCESFESSHSAHGTSFKINQDLGLHRDPVRMDSQAKYAAVAAGMADIYLRLPTRGDYREKIWDHAAGVYIVQAAGGMVSDVSGAPLDFSAGRTLKYNRGVVASAPGIYSEVVEAVKRRV